MAFHAYDRSLGARFVRSNVRVSGDTVIHDLVETNDLFGLLRAPPLHHDGVAFVYDDEGRITWKGPAPGRSTPADSAAAFLRRHLGRFQQWWQEAHPELVDSIRGPEGVRAGPRAGRLLLRLAREFAVREYLEAANRHDLAWIRDGFTEDVAWNLAGDIRHGLDEVMAPHATDIPLHTRLEGSVRRVAGDTVVVDVTERNDFVTALGLDSIFHAGVLFVFRGPKIAWMGPPPSAAPPPDPFGGALAPFFAWIQAEHPDDWARLVDQDGRPSYGEEAGRIMLRLVRQWRTVQAGGAP